MKNTRWTLMAALLLAATSAAHAQAPGTMGARSAPIPLSGSGSSMSGSAMSGAPATTGAATDSGAISNAQSTETTTTTSSSGIGPDGVSVEVDPSLDTTALPSTGGEPILMSLVGLSMALGAFAIRKRVSA